MKIIVDTNIVFSAILNSNSRIGKILLNSKNTFSFSPVIFCESKFNDTAPGY